MIISIAALLMCAAVLTVFSHAYYKRSLMATLAEWWLRLTTKKETDEKVIADIDKLPKKTNPPCKIPRSVKPSSPVKEEFFRDMQLLRFNYKKSDVAVLYLHGGGYVRPPRIHHFRFISKLSSQINAEIIMAIYPKAPKFTYEKSFDILTELYKQFIKQYRRVILMWDSSGGGLAAALCLDLAEKNLPQPQKLILLSPWTDVSLTNPELDAYDKIDPMISASSERIWGKLWAKGTTVYDEKISPFYGNVKNLRNVTIFIGTRELLYPDVIRFHKKLLENEVNSTLIEGKGLNHVYPVFPIPEAKEARNIIAQIINTENI